ncbi:hypothetical protein [Azospirillum sp. ST 5-10]|uniref:hypothetical protein n=1 Tax=unclassified Azospirillum TaxID=2630922 RepID=UPI003F49E379
MSNRTALLDHYDLGVHRVAEVFHYDPDHPDGFTVETREDCAGLVEAAKDAADNEGGLRADGLRLEAVVPLDVLNRAFMEGWFHDNAAWKRWANDPANRDFRVSYHGRIKRL